MSKLSTNEWRTVLAGAVALLRKIYWSLSAQVALTRTSILCAEVHVSIAEFAQIATTLFLGLVGLWVAYNYRRQVRLALASRQLDAFLQVWRITEVAMPDRPTPLNPDERRQISESMARWYFADGLGIFLPVPTRDLFAAVGSNLDCGIAQMKPPSLARQLAALAPEDAERRRGCVSIRQLALLRTALKEDMAIHFGNVYMRTLRADDRMFLRSCGISPWRRPWRRPLFVLGRTVDRDPCVCGMCR